MKTTKEMIEVMQACERSEQIEDCYGGNWKEIDLPSWNWGLQDYRVKHEQKFVPFDTAEEFFAAQRKHGCGLITIEDGKQKSHDVSITLDGRVLSMENTILLVHILETWKICY